MEAVRVYIRVRPVLPIDGDDATTAVDVQDGCRVSVSHGQTNLCGEYDGAFDCSASQAAVYGVVETAVDCVLEGINCTIFAYGQTG